MNWKRAVTRITIAAALVLLMFPAIARADSINYTDTTGINGVTFSLTGSFSTCAGTNSVCTGNIHVDTSGASISNGNWYIGWFEIKLDTNTSVVFSTSQAGWAAANGNNNAVALWWTQGSNPIPEDHYSAIYNTNFLFDAALTSADIQSGLLVNGNNTYNIPFTFNFSGSALNPSPSLKVGYYSIDATNTNPKKPNASSTNPFIAQMSQQSSVVPEPGSMALFGTGLVGVAAFVRRRSRMAV